MDTGSLIRRARAEAGWTQADLAERLGTSQPAIARLESAGSNPTVATLERVLGALGRRLEVRTAWDDVDLPQIDSHLAMTPSERLQAHDSARRDVARLIATARRDERAG